MKALSCFLMMFVAVASTRVQAEDMCRSPQRINEAAALQAAEGRVAREGQTLRIRTQSRVIEYLDTDCSGESSVSACRQHEFLGRLPNHWFLINVGYWEGGAYVLIDPTSGETRQFDSCPRLSPSGNRFVIVAGDESGYENEILQIWSIKTQWPLLLWTEPQMAEYAVKREQLAQIMTAQGNDFSDLRGFEGPVYSLNHWIDDNRIVLTDSANNSDAIKRDVLLINDVRGWVLKPLP